MRTRQNGYLAVASGIRRDETSVPRGTLEEKLDDGAAWMAAGDSCREQKSWRLKLDLLDGQRGEKKEKWLTGVSQTLLFGTRLQGAVGGGGGPAVRVDDILELIIRRSGDKLRDK